jgi:hypothetical protein
MFAATGVRFIIRRGGAARWAGGGSSGVMFGKFLLFFLYASSSIGRIICGIWLLSRRRWAAIAVISTMPHLVVRG